MRKRQLVRPLRFVIVKTKHKQMPSKRKRLISSLFLVMILCVVGVVYVATFHMEDLQRMVRELIARSFGEHVVIEQMQVSFFPYPQLELTGISINDPKQGTPIFQASHIQLDLSFLSLIQDTPMPNALIIENAFLDLERNEKGQWNYRNILQQETTDQVGIGTWLSGRSLKLTNGSVHLEDRYRRESAFIVHAEEVELQVEQLVLDGPTEVFLSARFSERVAGSVISSYGTLQHIGGFLGVGSTARHNASPQFDLHTRMDLDRKTLLQLADLFDVRGVPVGLQGRTKAQGHIHFAPGLEGYDLVLSDLVVLTDSIDLNAEVSVTGLLRPEPPTFSGQWTSGPVAVQHLPYLLPAELVPSELYDAIHRQTISGKIQAISATFTGSARKEAGYSLTGKFQFSEGTVGLSPKLGKIEEIACTIHIEPDQIRLSDFQGQYEQIPLTQGTGTIVFTEQGPWLTTEFGGKVPSKKFVGLMQTIFESNAPQHPIQSLQGQAGSGLVTVRFAGPLKNPQAITFQSAEYHPEQIAVQLPGLQAPLTQVEGILAFSKEHLRFENVTGLYGQSNFQIEGKIKFEEQLYLDEVRIRGRFSDNDLLNLFSAQALSAQKLILGKTDYLIMLAGKLQNPTMRGRIALQGLEILLPGILYKPSTLAGNLDFHVQVGKNHRFTFERMILTLPSVRFAGQGEFHYDQTLTFNASLKAEPINFESLPPELELFDKTISSGTLEGLVNLRGTGSDWRSWNKSGWVALTNGVVKVEGIRSPISQVVLQVKLDGHTAELKQLQWNFEESQAQATGIIRTWDSKPKMNMAFTSPQFNIDLLLPKKQPSPLRKFLEKIAITAKVKGKLRFDRASYHNLHFQKLTGQLRIENGIIRVDRIRGKVDDGTLQGRLFVHLPVQQPATMQTWFKVHSIPLLTLERTFFDEEMLEKRLMTGLLSAEGTLQGHGKNPLGVLPTLKGTLKLSIVDGRIKRGIVIPKILALMNLPSMLQGTVDLEKDGYPFDRQAGTFAIADGRIVSKDIVMDGPILKMTAAGQYDLVNDKLDVVTAASPLGPYFEFFQKIPLLHLLLDGKERGVDLAMFSVKGSLHAPTIEPMAVESVASGLTGFATLALTILKNTLTLPQKILFPEDNKEPGSQLNDPKEQKSEDTDMESY